MNILPMALVLVVLTGCATTPKPVMPESVYSQVGGTWLAVHYCNDKGWISPDTAALGKRYATGYMQEYRYDSERILREARSLESSGRVPSQGECNSLAMAIQDRRQQIDINNYNVEANQRATQELINSNRIKNTYCNRIGLQTFCNTY